MNAASTKLQASEAAEQLQKALRIPTPQGCAAGRDNLPEPTSSAAGAAAPTNKTTDHIGRRLRFERAKVSAGGFDPSGSELPRAARLADFAANEI